jgi:hypothetical protein
MASDKFNIFVDGEKYDATKAVMTANEIIAEFGMKDPATNYLVLLHGNDPISFKGEGEKPIELKNGMKFQIVSLGPTPVSNGQ